MKKTTLNQKGIQQKQEDMLLLTPNELQQELKSMLYDTSSWILKNFYLSPSQRQRLNSAPEAFLRQFNFSLLENCNN